MRIIAMVAIAAVEMMARAEQPVTVYLNDDLGTRGAVYQAREKAAKAFAEIGVRIDWRSSHASRASSDGGQVILVSLADHTPATFRPGALAYAQVFDGVHITVFWDRIELHSRLAPPSVVLAHVLVHEITHILQGIDRHSDSGVMKAQWTVEDYRAMASKPLPFTPHDVELIQHSLALRPGLRAMAAATLFPYGPGGSRRAAEGSPVVCPSRHVNLRDRPPTDQ